MKTYGRYSNRKTGEEVIVFDWEKGKEIYFWRQIYNTKYKCKDLIPDMLSEREFRNTYK